MSVCVRVAQVLQISFNKTLDALNSPQRPRLAACNINYIHVYVCASARLSITKLLIICH